MKDVVGWVAAYRRFWDPSYDRLDAYLDALKEQERNRAGDRGLTSEEVRKRARDRDDGV